QQDRLPSHMTTVGGGLPAGYPDVHGACVRRSSYRRRFPRLGWLGSSLGLRGRVLGLAPAGSASPAIGRAVEERWGGQSSEGRGVMTLLLLLSTSRRYL